MLLNGLILVVVEGVVEEQEILVIQVLLVQMVLLVFLVQMVLLVFLVQMVLEYLLEVLLVKS
jgi:hypothetical protein